MTYNDTTNKNGIVQFTESLCRLGDGGITNDTTLFLQITGYINQAYKKVATALLRVDKRWKWDDTNYTDFPIGSIDLVASQRDYTLPVATTGANASTLYKINRVRIQDSNENFHELTLMDDNEKESDETGFPTKYRLIGNSIRFNYLPTGITTTDGLEITFQRSLTEFDTSSTTTQPGFMDSYHDLLAYDAASSYLMPVNSDLAIFYSQTFNNRLAQLQTDYANRNDDVPRRLTPLIENNK